MVRKYMKALYDQIGLKHTILIVYGLLLVGLVVSISLAYYFKIEKSVKSEVEGSLTQTISQVDNNIDYTLGLYETVKNRMSVQIPFVPHFKVFYLACKVGYYRFGIIDKCIYTLG